jgi:hypothetical protein
METPSAGNARLLTTNCPAWPAAPAHTCYASACPGGAAHGAPCAAHSHAMRRSAPVISSRHETGLPAAPHRRSALGVARDASTTQDRRLGAVMNRANARPAPRRRLQPRRSPRAVPPRPGSGADAPACAGVSLSRSGFCLTCRSQAATQGMIVVVDLRLKATQSSRVHPATRHTCLSDQAGIRLSCILDTG